ncbi:MAG: acetate--CoA ligase family protein [Desulfomonilia bacterium]
MTCSHPETARDSFERIFHPESIAIMGVSEKWNLFGNGVLDSHLEIGFPGTIYPVNSRGGQYRDLKIYTTLDEIPEPVDFAIIAVPADAVPPALEQCRQKGVAGAEVLSAGFSETGTAEGASLEREIQEIAARGIRVIGPNCFGIYCPESGLTMLPGADFSREKGPVAFTSQSGGMSADFAQIGKWMGVRFSKVISFGNGADLRENELLNYFGQDPETKIITMYIEGVKEGREFLEVLKQASREKPVIINKGGLSEAGSRAVESHTASLGGSRVIWESVLRQAGAIQVGDLWELAQAALAFSMLPIREYRGITFAGAGGAFGVSAGDSAERFGMELPLLDSEISEKIMEVLPRPGSSARNPIDAANPFTGPQAYREAFLQAAKDPRVDIQVLIQLLHHYKSLALGFGLPVKDVVPFREFAEVCREVVDITGKPILLVLPDYKQGQDSMDIEAIIRETRDVFLKHGIPVYSDIDEALRSVSHVSRYASWKARL